jgi:hypothetical protein
VRAQVEAYGACISANFHDIKQGSCEKEFAAVRVCFQKAVRDRKK